MAFAVAAAAFASPLIGVEGSAFRCSNATSAAAAAAADLYGVCVPPDYIRHKTPKTPTEIRLEYIRVTEIYVRIFYPRKKMTCHILRGVLLLRISDLG